MIRNHYIRNTATLIIFLVILSSPYIRSTLVVQGFNKSLYPDGTLVITSTPMATFPRDLQYCFVGQSDLSVHVVYHNFELTYDIYDHMDEQLLLADIRFTYEFSSVSEPDTVYFDFELEDKALEYKQESNSDFVLVLTNMMPPEDSVYGNLAGYSRVQKNFAVVFTEQLGNNPNYISAISLHELSHCLGYGHSDDSTDVMYPSFFGTNLDYTQDTIDAIYELHH